MECNQLKWKVPFGTTLECIACTTKITRYNGKHHVAKGKIIGNPKKKEMWKRYQILIPGNGYTL